MGGGRRVVRDLLLVLVIHMVHQSRKHEKDYDVFAERARNKSM